jgi:hypothetical protein
LGFISYEAGYDRYFNLASKFFLFASGISGSVLILMKVVQAYRQRRKIQKTLLVVKNPDLKTAGARQAA